MVNRWNHAPKQSYIHHLTEKLHQGLDRLRYFLDNLHQIFWTNVAKKHPARVFPCLPVNQYGDMEKPPTKMIQRLNVDHHDHHDHVEKNCFNHKMAISPHVPVPCPVPRRTNVQSTFSPRSVHGSERLAPQIPNFQESQRPSYPLVMTNITTENHHVSWENSLSMVIFHSYVSHYQRVRAVPKHQEATKVIIHWGPAWSPCSTMG